MVKKMKIERVPLREPKPGADAIYPWRELKIGQSFFVAVGDRNARKKQQKLGTLAAAIKRRHGLAFATRREPQGVRVHRIK